MKLFKICMVISLSPWIKILRCQCLNMDKFNPLLCVFKLLNVPLTHDGHLVLLFFITDVASFVMLSRKLIKTTHLS